MCTCMTSSLYPPQFDDDDNNDDDDDNDDDYNNNNITVEVAHVPVLMRRCY